MDTNVKLLNLFNKIFWTIIIIVLINEAYHLFKPKFVKFYRDKNIVTNVDIINELEECIEIYFDSINFKRYERSNRLNALLNKKDYSEYEEIYNNIKVDYAYKTIVKYAYDLGNETYRCYVLVEDLTSDDYKYITNNDKNTMYEIVVKLNLNNSTFKIIYDDFRLEN